MLPHKTSHTIPMIFLFHTYDMSMTGGSKVCAELINSLAENGHKVHLLLDRNKIAFNLNSNISIHLIKKNNISKIKPDVTAYFAHRNKRAIQNKKPKKHPKLSKKVRDIKKSLTPIKEAKLFLKYLINLSSYQRNKKTYQKFISTISPDIVVTTNMYNDLEKLIYLKTDNTVLWLHNSPVEVFQNRTIRKLLPLNFYFKNLKFISVSNGIKDELKKFSPAAHKKCQRIYNPFNFELIQKSSQEPVISEIKDKKFIITIGSLNKLKSIDRIINALHKLKDNDLHLVILGHGGEENNLKKLAVELDISHKVHFLGTVSNPYNYIKRAKALVHASNSEGLPTVLIESLILGTPVVSTDCPTGPSEILIGNLKEYLVPIQGKTEDQIITTMSKKINTVLSSPPKIHEESLSRFNKENITKQWIELALSKKSNSDNQ